MSRNGTPSSWLRHHLPWKYPVARLICKECLGRQIVWRETVVVECPVCDGKGWVLRSSR